MELTRNNIKVEWVELGEGVSGDFDPDDPDDIELLRFDVSFKNGSEWTEIPDASYCTRFPVNACPELKLRALEVILDEYCDALCGEYNENSPSVKKLGEHLSWICPEDFE